MIERGVPPVHTLAPSHASNAQGYLLTADSVAYYRVQYPCFERQVHGFVTMSRVIDAAWTAVDVCAAALRRALTTPPARA